MPGLSSPDFCSSHNKKDSEDGVSAASRRVWTILFGMGCLAVLFSPTPAHADGGAPQLAYVSGTTHGISVINISQQKVTDTLPVPGNPQMILLSTDGRLLYVTQPALQRVTVIATKSKQPFCSVTLPGHPSLLTLDAGTNMLYAAGTDSGTVTALNPMTCQLVRTLKVQGLVSGLAVATVGGGLAGGNGNQIWIAATSELDVFNAAGKQLARLPFPTHPQYLCSPPGKTLYVTTQQGEVAAINLDTQHIRPPLLSGGSFGAMDYDATTGEIYVPDFKHKLLDVLAPVTENSATSPQEPRRQIPFEATPQSIAITSDGQLGFSALANGSVMMLDIPGRQTIARIFVGGSPHFIITGLYPSFISLTPQQSVLLTFVTSYSHYAAIAIILIALIVAIIVHKLQGRRTHV